MIYSYGGRVDNDSNAITVIDEENKTAVTTGYVNGEYVEFGGGGGGTSEFSTAEMQIVNNTENNFQIDIIIVNDEDGIGMGASCLAGESQTFSVVLYKDLPTSGKYTPESLAGTISGTGSIEIEEEYGDVYVSGDCIITLSENA